MVLNLLDPQVRQTLVRTLPSLARYKTSVAILLPQTHKPFEVAQADPGALCRFSLAKAPLNRRTDQLRALPFLGTH